MSKGIIGTELVETINNVEVRFNIVDTKFSVSSRDVANVFEKRHDNVTRDIEKIIKDLNSLSIGDPLKIEEIFYSDKYGRKQKSYQLDRDAFSLLVMGFTGSRAFEWKIRYIDAFNKMEEMLQDKTTPLNSAERYELEQFRASKDVSGEFMEDGKNGHFKIKRVKGYWRTDKDSKVDHQIEKLKELNRQIKKSKEKLNGLLDAEIMQLIEKKITEKNELLSSF